MSSPDGKVFTVEGKALNPIPSAHTLKPGERVSHNSQAPKDVGYDLSLDWWEPSDN